MRILPILVALLVSGPAFAVSSVAPAGSSTQVTPTNGNTSRPLGDWVADAYNVKGWGAKGDCTTNDSAAIQAVLNAASAAATGNAQSVVSFPATPNSCYAIGTTISVPSNVRLEPMGGVLLKSIAPGTGAFFSLSNVNNVSFGAFKLDSRNSVNLSIAQPISVNNSFDIWFDRVKLVNPTGSFVITNSYRVHVLQPDVQNGLYHGVYFQNVYESEVIGGYFQSNVGFGVILTGVSYKNLIQGNRTTHNGIELVGITAGGYQNRVIGNHAEGTGDNCISITGHENLVQGNEAIGCAGNGINVYGDRNVVTGNYAKNNSQSYATNSSWRAGIAVAQGFGGMAQYNVVTGNVVDDDQASPTQQYGIWIAPAAYVAWSSSRAVTAGSYYYNGLNLYQAVGAGTTGATPPTCTTGTCSDGVITWTFVSSFLAGNVLADKNEISGNNYVRAGIQKTIDQSAASNNEFVGGFASVVIPSALQVSSVSNAGGVSSLTIVGNGSYNNGVLPTLTIAAPSAGGTQATAHTATMKILGFGTVVAGSAGCSVNDILTVTGGTVTGGVTGDQIKVLTVDGNGAVLTFTGQRFTDYNTTPNAGNTVFSGGTCTTPLQTSGMVWQISTVAVDSSGSGYLTIPAVTAQSGNLAATLTAQLSSQLTVNAGVGQVLMNSSGTLLGTSGSGGAPVLSKGAFIDASGVRQSLGSTYTVPANTSLVRFIQSSTVATSTVTLPTALADGQPIQFVNYTGAITALTFSPAVTGWTNGSTLTANTGLRIRWDATSAAWFREQ